MTQLICIYNITLGDPRKMAVMDYSFILSYSPPKTKKLDRKIQKIKHWIIFITKRGNKIFLETPDYKQVSSVHRTSIISTFVWQKTKGSNREAKPQIVTRYS